MSRVSALCVAECRKFEQNVLNEPIERRWVQTPSGLYDPDAVPPEWYQWLRKRRDAAPSLEEVQQYVEVLIKSQLQAFKSDVLAAMVKAMATSMHA